MSIDPNNLAGTATMTFDDEFNSLSLWNGSSGTWSTTLATSSDSANGASLTGNNEQEWYINNNYGPTSSVVPWTVNNGVLSLTAAPADSSIQPLINNYKYTSGLLESSHSFSQEYGYFEISAKLPAGQGFWPAFWLMPENNTWPPELDVMEVLGKDPTTLYTTVHTGSNNASDTKATTVADMSTGYHTYGVDWESDYITWYFDNQEVYKVATPSDMHQPMYMLLNLAVGGYWPGYVDSTTPFPSSMNIDWVRAYQSKPADATTPSTPTTPSDPTTTPSTPSTPPTTTTTTPSTPTTTPSTPATTPSTPTTTPTDPGTTTGGRGGHTISFPSLSGFNWQPSTTTTNWHPTTVTTHAASTAQTVPTTSGQASSQQDLWASLHLTNPSAATDSASLSQAFEALGANGRVNPLHMTLDHVAPTSALHANDLVFN